MDIVVEKLRYILPIVSAVPERISKPCKNPVYLNPKCGKDYADVLSRYSIPADENADVRFCSF